MAAYADLPDLQDLMKQYTINTTSVVTDTEALRFASDIADEINVALAGQGIVVPVTTPTYFADWLATLNSYGAVAGILESWFPDSEGAGENSAAKFWEKRYRDGLNGIMTGELIPVDVSLDVVPEVMPSTYFIRNPDVDEDLGAIAEPFFTRRRVF